MINKVTANNYIPSEVYTDNIEQLSAIAMRFFISINESGLIAQLLLRSNNHFYIKKNAPIIRQPIVQIWQINSVPNIPKLDVWNISSKIFIKEMQKNELNFQLWMIILIVII